MHKARTDLNLRIQEGWLQEEGAHMIAFMSGFRNHCITSIAMLPERPALA